MIRYITSESVTEGHPDKICDQISDAVLDEMLKQDENARCACDVAVNTGLVLVMGEISCDCYVDIPKIARGVVKDVGYTDAAYGFDCQTCAVVTGIEEQSPDIALGVDESAEYKERGGAADDPLDKVGAGDQGMMYGFACTETPELMPLPITLAHKLTRELARARKAGAFPYLRPDGKAQVTVAYVGGKPLYIDTVVLSTQHAPETGMETLRRDMEGLIRKALPKELLRPETKYYVNPTGRFVIGGPRGDSGLTGRKIIVDTYGGYIPHGGGAFSGKDPTKVDRSAAYMARYVCKNVVAARLADRCQLEVAYAIGRARPVALYLDTFGTGKAPDEELTAAVGAVFDFRPAAIIETLGLRRPIYRQTANYGHFGNPAFPWEKTDRADALAAVLGSEKFGQGK
ncbi:MAG: methionine adenosyltransferase [Clostridiales bacterium]|nr:methionine adenosyltransferase [Clostridiales bacterium]